MILTTCPGSGLTIFLILVCSARNGGEGGGMYSLEKTLKESEGFLFSRQNLFDNSDKITFSVIGSSSC